MSFGHAHMQALHRNHSPPTGAHVTGDAQTGFSLHLRPIDDTNAANGVLRRFMEVCSGNRQPQVSGTVSDAAPQQPPNATPQRQPSTGPPQRLGSSPAPGTGPAPGPAGPPPLALPPPSTAPSGRMTTAWGPPPPSREHCAMPCPPSPSTSDCTSSAAASFASFQVHA